MIAMETSITSVYTLVKTDLQKIFFFSNDKGQLNDMNGQGKSSIIKSRHKTFFQSPIFLSPSDLTG